MKVQNNTPAEDVKDDKIADAKPHYATRDFNDVGTGRSFKSGDELKEVQAGELENYAAAGLVSLDRPESTSA